MIETVEPPTTVAFRIQSTTFYDESQTMNNEKNKFEETRQAWRIALGLVLGLAGVGVFQFIMVVPVCISRFPKNEEFSTFFLSELGRSTFATGWLFNGSLIFLGLSIIPAFASLLVIDSRQSISMRIAICFGISSAVGVVFLGLSPVDRHFIGHMFAMALWVFPMMYTIVPFFFSASRHPQVSFWFVGASLMMFVIMLTVLMIRQDSNFHLVQKMIATCGCVWLSFILWYIGLVGYQAIDFWRPSREEIVERESQSYLETIAPLAGRKTPPSGS